MLASFGAILALVTLILGGIVLTLTSQGRAWLGRLFLRVTLNLLRSRVGRAFMAIREHDIAARAKNPAPGPGATLGADLPGGTWQAPRCDA